MDTTMTTLSKPAKKKKTSTSIILLGADANRPKWLIGSSSVRVVLCKAEKDISLALPNATKSSVWISAGPKTTDQFVRVVGTAGIGATAQKQIGKLLMLKSPKPNTIPFLKGLVGTFAGESPDFKMLPKDQLAEVLANAENGGQDVFIGGDIDSDLGLLTLVRGNFDRITVPLSIFRPNPIARPDFQKLEFDDYGHTVRFGDYEASTHSILYEADDDYRKRAKAKRRATDVGFGPSLRRLRTLKGVPQSGFQGVEEKTIGRLERGEVAKPQSKTLAIIAQTLGVKPQEIETY